MRRKRSPLRVVGPDEAPAPVPSSEGSKAEPVPSEAGEGRRVGPVGSALREELAAVFSKHPAARTLERIAEVLAVVLDSRSAVAADPRIVPPVSRELRSVVQELVTHREVEEDDLFGGGGPVVVGD